MIDVKKVEWVKWSISTLIQIILIVVSIVLAYGTLDKRITVIGAEQQRKVDGEELHKQLKQWKNEIINEIQRIKK